MLSTYDPLPFMRLPSGNDWVKSDADVTVYSCTTQTNYTIRIRPEDTIRPNTNTIFGTLFGIEANMKRVFGTSLEISNIVDMLNEKHSLMKN